MKYYASLPYLFFVFWYGDLPKGIVHFFTVCYQWIDQVLSFRLFLRTFFKPAKNEYRKGLVFISIALSIPFKLFFIIFDIGIFLCFFLFEVFLILFVMLLPIVAVLLLLSNS